MKRLLNKKLLGAITVLCLLIIPVLYQVPSNRHPSPIAPAITSAAGCTINEASISPHTEQGSGGDDTFYSNATRNSKPVSVSVYTTGCAGSTIYVSLTRFVAGSVYVGNEAALDKKGYTFVSGGTGAVRFTLIPGEELCEMSAAEPDCRYGIRVGLSNSTYDYNSYDLRNGRLEYECEGVCNDSWVYKSLSSIPNPYATPYIPKSGCSIVSGTISPSTAKGSFDNGYYSDPNRKNKKVSLKVYTSGCENERIYVSLSQFNTFDKPTNGWVVEDYDSADVKGNPNVSTLNRKPIISSTGAFEIQMYPGQEKCTAAPGVADCRYSMRLGVTPTTYSWTTRNDPSGNLDYDCDSTNGTCPDKGKWEIISITEIPNTPPPGTPPPTPNPTPVTEPPITSADSCTDKDCYEAFKGVENALGAQFSAFSEAQDLTDFINALVAFGIAIAGLLAVVMIMYEGFLYMKTDNVTTKATARSRIVNTIAGFVLLLSMYTLLRTINPDLLILMPHLEGVTLDVGTESDTNEALDNAIEKSPDLAKIYATSKGHWRDAGSLIPKTEEARKTKANSIPASDLYNLQTNGFTIKSGVNKFVHTSVGPKLKALDTALKSQGITLIVTEAFKPTTYKHFAACHYTATCIDGDITFNAVHVATLISEAQKAGLVAVWETKNQSDYNKLINLGVPKSNVILFKGHITGDHASIYDYQ